MRTYNNIERPDFTPRFIKSLKPDEIFVFGSNLAGAHGGGAARIAVEDFGAIWGQGVGLQGQCYAIPTMQGGVETIKPYVDEFIEFAKQHKVVKGIVASGDQFISDSSAKREIQASFEPACVEMEGCAIAQTCYLNKVPFVIVRCMSDMADDTVEQTYAFNEDICAEACACLVKKIIEVL